MQLVVKVTYSAEVKNENFANAYIHFLWEKFLVSLMNTYIKKYKTNTDIYVYVSQPKRKSEKMYFFEYVIPLELVDFYGRKNFKSILPIGCKIDLADEVRRYDVNEKGK